jgi:exodeoxyribonuclease VII large subunit
VARRRLRLAAATRSLAAAGRHDFERRAGRVAELAHELDLLSPLAVVARGYGLVRRAADGAVVREAGDAPPGERLALTVAQARLEAVVERAAPRDDGGT